MGTPIGSRVIAIMEVKNCVLKYFGSGIYAGDFELPTEISLSLCGVLNPRIDLDDGKTVWGCESWWGPEELVKQQFPEDKVKWVKVDIEDIRKEASSKQSSENSK